MKKSVMTSALSLLLVSPSLLATPISSIEISREIASISKYVSADSLNVRSKAKISGEKLGTLYINDEVQVIGPVAGSDYVEVLITKTSSQIKQSNRYFVSSKYLADAKVTDVVGGDPSKYIMIQNIATEKIRVYERVCSEVQACEHKMVFETNMVAGEDEAGTRTWLGSFKLTHWVKFYEDYAGLYPSWYNEDYPMPPKASKGIRSWFKKKYMPEKNGKKKGDMRGAFGWYAGFVGPNSNAQWTHGTIGWGEHQDKYIMKTKDRFANLLADPRSHGCSRTDNEAIAYLRNLLPVGTPVVKIYAREAYMDESLSRYTDASSTWDYILTKRDSQKRNGESADKESILSSGVSASEIIEEGTYSVDKMPNKVKFRPKELSSKLKRQRGKAGNVYGVGYQDMKGVFFVDTGYTYRYAHPKHKKIGVGGYKTQVVPLIIDMEKVLPGASQSAQGILNDLVKAERKKLEKKDKL